jgi:pimeloyl-ACP methyl ester carboxylesterase
MKKGILCIALLVFCAFAVASMPALSQSAAASLQTRSVASADGVRIMYDVRGQGDTALVFVHCWACNRFFWRNQVDGFSSQYRVVTLDLAGHGQSGASRKNWTVLSLAQDVVAVADDLKLKRMILIGHSLGGKVCLEATPMMKGRVLGVILVDIMHDASQRDTMAQAQADVANLRRDYKRYFRDLSPLFSKNSDPAIRKWVEEQAMESHPIPMIALKLDIPNVIPSELFARAGVPIRAINAMPPLSDPTNVAENKKYADYDVILIPHAGHFLQLERSNEFNQALDKWVLELAAGLHRGPEKPALPGESASDVLYRKSVACSRVQSANVSGFLPITCSTVGSLSAPIPLRTNDANGSNASIMKIGRPAFCIPSRATSSVMGTYSMGLPTASERICTSSLTLNASGPVTG